MTADRTGGGPKGSSPSAPVQFRGFLNKFAPATVADARAALLRVRKLVPGAVELVYDNYNGLVVGFGPNERASDAVISLAIFPQWVTLCFIQNGPDIADPQHLLKGSGNVVRHVRLQSAKDLDTPAIRALIKSALSLADVPIDSKASRRMVIKSVSAKQRPRRITKDLRRRR